MVLQVLIGSLTVCVNSFFLYCAAEDEERTTSLQYHQVGLEKTVSGSLESRSTAIDDTYKTANAVFESYSSDHEKALSQTTVLSSGTAVDTNQLQGNGETEELILLVRSQNEEESSKSGTSQGPKVISSALPCGEISDTSYEDTVGKCQDTNTKVNKDSVSQTSLESERSGSDGSLTSQFSELKEFGGSSSDEPDEFLGGTCPQSELPNPVEGDIQAEFSSSSKFSHEIQIDILENIVEAAKDHKVMSCNIIVFWCIPYSQFSNIICGSHFSSLLKLFLYPHTLRLKIGRMYSF